MRTLLPIILILTASLVTAAELPLHPFSYTEGFEQAPPPLVLWASRGTAPTVNFLGPSTDRAFAGKQSLKIDVTFGDSTYYYFGLPLRVPCAGKLTMSARLWVAEGNENNVGFGANFIYPPTTHSGCAPFESFSKPTGEWKLIAADMVARGADSATGVMNANAPGVSGKDVGVFLDRWSLFLTGAPGKRVVAYLDDVRLEGEVPEETAYLAQVQANFDASRAAFQRQLQAWDAQLAATQASLAEAAGHTAEAPQLVAAIQHADQRCHEILAGFHKTGYASTTGLAELQREMAVLQHWPQALAALTQAQAAGRKFIIAPCNRAIMSPRKAGNELLSIMTGDKALLASACAGEYEPVSAIAYALQETKGLKVSCSALKGAAATIPAEAVDIRLLKSWFQGASANIGHTKEKWLIPELLLKDDKLVRVDLTKQDNFLRSTAADGTETYLKCSDPDGSNLKDARPVDAATLQPMDVAAGESREFWLTIHVPEAAKPGPYQGTITFVSDAGQATIPLQVTVQPFALKPSRLIYSLYYRGVLSADGKPQIGSEGKSEAQYRAEIADMKAHGVLYPTNYVGPNEQSLRRVLDLRRQEGLPTDYFYNLGYGVGPQKESELPAVREQVKWWLNFLKPYGYRQVYFYGIDEATGEALARQKAAWTACQEAGGRSFVACYKGTFEAMGKTLNTAVLAGPPDPEEAVKWHSVGSQPFCYANPQVGVEDPAVYRRNFGLVLWKAGFDGAMDYAYQHAFGQAWNDFDDNSYRDHIFAYPTMTGVVDTVAWEGFREAVDDVRYVTTLEAAIRAAVPAKRKAAAEAKRWLEALDPATADLDQTRAEMVEWIVKVR